MQQYATYPTAMKTKPSEDINGIQSSLFASVLATLVVPPAGIAALVFSVLTIASKTKGDYQTAKFCSTSAGWISSLVCLGFALKSIVLLAIYFISPETASAE